MSRSTLPPDDAPTISRLRRALHWAGGVGASAALWGVGMAAIQATGLQPRRPPEGFVVAALEHLALGALGGGVYGALLPARGVPSPWQRAGAGAAGGAVALGVVLLVTRWRLGPTTAIGQTTLAGWVGLLILAAASGALIALVRFPWTWGRRSSAA